MAFRRATDDWSWTLAARERGERRTGALAYLNLSLRCPLQSDLDLQDLIMILIKLAVAGMLSILPAGIAMAEPLLAPAGGAANTGVKAPPVTGGVPGGTVGKGGQIDTRSPDAPLGNTASPSNSRVPGTTPDVNIGGTPTSGPPGTGGAAGGPSLGNQ